MKLVSDKDTRNLIKQYLGKGWTLEDRGRHLFIRSPNGDIVTVPRTPSDWRGFMNLRAQLRRVEKGLVKNFPTPRSASQHSRGKR